MRSVAWLGLEPAQRRVLEDVLRRCERGEEIVLVAVSRGAPLAMIRARLARRTELDVAVIEALRVMPGLHGLGIATALVLAAERVLRERGRPLVEVRIASREAADRARYARLGYVEHAVGVDGRIVLRKSLDLLAARPLQLHDAHART